MPWIQEYANIREGRRLLDGGVKIGHDYDHVNDVSGRSEGASL